MLSLLTPSEIKKKIKITFFKSLDEFLLKVFNDRNNKNKGNKKRHKGGKARQKTKKTKSHSRK